MKNAFIKHILISLLVLSSPIVSLATTDKILTTNKGQTPESFDLSSRCSKSNNTYLLLGTANKFNIREEPSIESPVIAKRYKDSLFKYKQKLQNNWYELCEGFYVHKSVVKEISYQEALKYFKKVRKYEKKINKTQKTNRIVLTY